MEVGIYLLSNVKGFMVNAILQELKEEGFPVTQVPLNITEISRISEENGVFLLYLDQTEHIEDVLVFLKD